MRSTIFGRVVIRSSATSAAASGGSACSSSAEIRACSTARRSVSAR